MNQRTPDWLRDLDKKLSKILLSTVTLFEYFHENRFVIFVGDLDFDSLGEVWMDTDYTTCDFLEAESKALIYKYTRKKIYIAESLKELARNDFKSQEQIRHEKEQASIRRQLHFTQIALAISFVGLLASILLPILGTTAVAIKNDAIPTRVENLDELNMAKSVTESLSQLNANVIALTKEIENGNNASKIGGIELQLIEMNSKLEKLGNQAIEIQKLHNNALQRTP